VNPSKTAIFRLITRVATGLRKRSDLIQHPVNSRSESINYRLLNLLKKAHAKTQR
jgi:hypothetical protein